MEEIKFKVLYENVVLWFSVPLAPFSGIDSRVSRAGSGYPPITWLPVPGQLYAVRMIYYSHREPGLPVVQW